MKREMGRQRAAGERGRSERGEGVCLLQLVINKADYDLSIALTRALSFDIQPSLSPWLQKAAAQPCTLQ